MEGVQIEVSQDDVWGRDSRERFFQKVDLTFIEKLEFGA